MVQSPQQRRNAGGMHTLPVLMRVPSGTAPGGASEHGNGQAMGGGGDQPLSGEPEGGGRLNAAAEQVITALGNTALSADELKRRQSYQEFCDCDVCERIIFRTKTPLESVYYLKANEKKALRLYVQVNWLALKGMILSDESNLFPATLAKAVDNYIYTQITSLEADLSYYEDEIVGVEHKIEDYENLRR